MFWKLFFGSFGITAIRTVCAFITNKFLALFLGPAGFALVGQFQNIFAIGQGASSLSLQNGWVSITAKYKGDKEKLLGMWRGGYRLTVYATIAVAVIGILFLFIAPLHKIFPGVPVRAVQAAILFLLPGIVATNLTLICTSVMNGLSAYKRFAIISIASSILQAVWIVVMLYTKTLTTLSVIALQSVLTVAVSIPVARGAGFKISELKSIVAYKFEERKPWIKFALMGILPMILSPVVLMLVRSHLGFHFGWRGAGLWQGVYRISDFFSVAVSSALGVVLLPKLSVKLSYKEFKKTFYPILWRVLLVVALLVVFFFAFKGEIVVLFLSESFLSAKELLQWQLIGDFFRAGGVCFALVLISRQELFKFAVVETVFSVFFVVCTMNLTPHIGLIAPSVAYMMENFLYCLSTFLFVRTIKWDS